MKAMILAAGFGTRLKPLTDKLPKALVPFRNGTIISYQIDKLKKLGVDEIIINTHHFSKLIENYFKENNFDLKISLIAEEQILGTGGGILNAKEYFKNEDNFLVINTDVYTDFPFKELIENHNNNFATLSVQKRNTTRYLRFDEEMNLLERIKTIEPEKYDFAFNGIHVISSDIFKLGLEIKYTDIIDIYLSARTKGFTIKGYDVKSSTFDDLGKIEVLKKLNK